MNRRSLSAENLHADRLSDPTIRRLSLKSRKYDRWTIFCVIMGSIGVLNGLWMLIAPKHWFYNLPAGVPEYGPLNVHFIRDIGCIFLLTGVGMLVAAVHLPYRLPLFTMNTAFYVLHMLVHVHEVVSGRIRLSMFWTDLPGVYVPGVVLLILNVFMIRQARNGSQTRYNIRH